MTRAVELPSVHENEEVIDVDVDAASKVESQTNKSVFVSGIDLTSYLQDPPLQSPTPLERFNSYGCRMEALFVNAGPAPPESRPQYRGRSRVGKRKGRRSSVRAQRRPVCGKSTSNRS